MAMSDRFSFDVFLSYSSKDKHIVRPIAEHLRKDGLRVWFDDWEIRPGDSIPAKIDAGLEASRVLVLCMSTHAFGADWVRLEAGTFRFRDPLNIDRRFIPLRLDTAPIRGSLSQFLYINWLQSDREQLLEYSKLLEACRPPAEPATVDLPPMRRHLAEKVGQLDKDDARILAYSFSHDGKHVLTGSDSAAVQLWNMQTGQCIRLFQGHTNQVWSVILSADGKRALSGSWDNTARLWEVKTGRCLRVLQGHTDAVWCIAWSPDEDYALSGGSDHTVRIWDLKTGRCEHTFRAHTSEVRSVAWSADQRRVLSASADRTLRLWDRLTGRCLRVLEGHTDIVFSSSWSADQRRVFSGSGRDDRSARLWELEHGKCLGIFGGHTGYINSVALSKDERHGLTGDENGHIYLWDLKTGHCLSALDGHQDDVRTVIWSQDQRHVFSGDRNGVIQVWNLTEFAVQKPTAETAETLLPLAPEQVHYTNAKVLLVGDSGAGKTGLSKRLALNDWQPSDSTVGVWATQWKLPVTSADGVEREIWLWDFGGQADQRLIHQLYMEDTALVVLVFDGQKEDLFETLTQWDRDLTRASLREFSKLLVAGRVDAGGLRVSRSQVEAFAKERGYSQFLETSAKRNLSCEELKHAIQSGIRWEDIPWRSSPLLFKRLKEEIVRLKDEGRVLMRFNELRDALHLRLASEESHFKDEELKAVVGLLAGPGIVWELAFGSWVLLQPERINAYAQAVIQTLRSDEHERGSIAEEKVLGGKLAYLSSLQRLGSEEERIVLLAMHQTLVERGLCLREHTEVGPLLIFPSYYRRERPDRLGHPAALVSYQFSGFLDDIYATLVVRLHHTKPFEQDQLWRYAADFKTLTGKQLGVKMSRRTAGAGELEVYFDPTIPVEEKIIFSRYIHEHLLQKGQTVVRLRHYLCPHCSTPVGNREVAMRRLESWLEQNSAEITAARHKSHAKGHETPTIICSECEERVPLWDDLEQIFASPEVQRRVRELQQQSAIVLDNESKERALVGEVISTVALAGQISREFSVSDHGIDMEIEFKNDAGEASGQKLYLQLKSGDSHLRQRQRREVFPIKDERHVRYWMAQAFPVLLVVRNARGEVRWMEVRNWLKRISDEGKKTVSQIVFEGERFDVMSVRRWREIALRQPS